MPIWEQFGRWSESRRKESAHSVHQHRLVQLLLVPTLRHLISLSPLPTLPFSIFHVRPSPPMPSPKRPPSNGCASFFLASTILGFTIIDGLIHERSISNFLISPLFPFHRLLPPPFNSSWFWMCKNKEQSKINSLSWNAVSSYLAYLFPWGDC